MMVGLWEMSGGKAMTNLTEEKSGSARSRILGLDRVN